MMRNTTTKNLNSFKPVQIRHLEGTTVNKYSWSTCIVYLIKLKPFWLKWGCFIQPHNTKGKYARTTTTI